VITKCGKLFGMNGRPNYPQIQIDTSRYQNSLIAGAPGGMGGMI
jgi:hypothetical protein